MKVERQELLRDITASTETSYLRVISKGFALVKRIRIIK